MRAASPLIAIAVGLATLGAAAAGMKQPAIASIGPAVQGEENGYSAAANSCAKLEDEVNAKDRSDNNTFREPSPSD